MATGGIVIISTTMFFRFFFALLLISAVAAEGYLKKCKDSATPDYCNRHKALGDCDSSHRMHRIMKDRCYKTCGFC
ncbi:hypothetical protein Q1695_005622 [Nippostrongylus brasiliensis]|nr:hypothetical protein Q1695_005622 [Nippostrongylus brasiliensis]